MVDCWRAWEGVWKRGAETLVVLFVGEIIDGVEVVIFWGGRERRATRAYRDAKEC